MSYEDISLPPSRPPGKLPFVHHPYSELKPSQRNHVVTWETYQAAIQATKILATACNHPTINHTILVSLLCDIMPKPI